ncbi:MAG: hypothetical protein IT204_22250 [Fimbriimonadaceae bacterium]|nr:hypothetical protein [Fimbriimonadaceae bacterium]
MADEGHGGGWAAAARRAPGVVLGYGLGLALLQAVELPSASLAIGLTVLSWLGFAALLLTAIAGLAARPLPRWAVLLGLALGVAVWGGLSYGLGERPPAWVTAPAAVAMVVAMGGLGRLLSWLFREPALLPPAMLIAGLVDLWGVNHGVVAAVAEHSPETLTKVSATLPQVASSAATAFPLADLSIGPGDLAVAALILAVAAAQGWDCRRNLAWMYGLTIAGLALVLATGWNVPGLVFIGLAGVVANRGEFRYSPAERRALGLAVGLIAGLLAALTWLMRTSGT